MKLMKWYPGVTGVTTFQDEVEDLFNTLFLANRRRVDMGSGVWIPRVNIREHEDKYELTAEIPGMNKDEISIELQDNNLTIRGEKKVRIGNEGRDVPCMRKGIREVREVLPPSRKHVGRRGRGRVQGWDPVGRHPQDRKAQTQRDQGPGEVAGFRSAKQREPRNRTAPFFSISRAGPAPRRVYRDHVPACSFFSFDLSSCPCIPCCIAAGWL